MMKVMKKKVCKCPWVRKVFDIVLLIPSTVPQVIVKFVDIGIKIPATLSQVITEVVDVGQV